MALVKVTDEAALRLTLDPRRKWKERHMEEVERMAVVEAQSVEYA